MGAPMLGRGSTQGANRFAGLPASRRRTIAAGGRGVVLQLRRSRSLRLRRQSGGLSAAVTEVHVIDLAPGNGVTSNRDVELNVNFNYDRTTPGKGFSGAFVD